MSRVDIKIVAGNDAENPVFANSKLLRLLCNNKWNQLLDSAVANDNTIYIPQISRPVMENVIKYIIATLVDPNPQPIPICDENVRDHFTAGLLLEMEEIQTFCLDYLNARESTLENVSFLFKLMGDFDHPLVASKIRDFFMQNSHQLDKIVRKCKSEGVLENTLEIALVDWLSSRDDLKGINLDLSKLLQEFSNADKKFRILRGFFQIGDSEGENKAFHLLLDIAKTPSNCHHTSISSQTENENHHMELLNLEEFQVNLDNFENLPNWLKIQMDQLEKNEEFPSFIFVNNCFFESEALRQEFCFISQLLPSCTENQSKNWLCNAHSDCTNKFNLMEMEQPPIFIKKSPISGIGLFTKSRLVEGQVICPYAGKITTTCSDVVYPMEIFDENKKEYTIDASEYGNLGRFANGELNVTHNVVFDGILGSSSAMAVLRVVKEIAPGEEIIAKYGEKYWDNLKNEQINGKESGSSKSESLAVPGSPSPSKLRAMKTYHNKRRCIEGPEINNNNYISNELDSDEDSENSQRKKVVRVESCGSSSSSSSISFPSPTFSTSSSESELGQCFNRAQTTNTNICTTNLNGVSGPQGIVYFLLGTRQNPMGLQFWSFNIKRKTYRLEGNLPEALDGRRKLAMLHHNGDIYFMGGEDCESGKVTSEVHIFNLESQERQMMTIIEPRFDFKAVVLNNCIYTVGGCLEDPTGPTKLELGTNVVEKLSLEASSPKWEFADCLVHCRSDAGLVVLNGKIFAIGGNVATNPKGKMFASNLCECFDPTIPFGEEHNQWNPIAPMKYKRLGLSAVATSDHIFALGGTKGYKESDKGRRTVEIYDPVTNSWILGPEMNRRRKFFSAVFFENCIYAIGGDNENSRPTMEKFSMETQTWTVGCKVKTHGNFLTVAFS